MHDYRYRKKNQINDAQHLKILGIDQCANQKNSDAQKMLFKWETKSIFAGEVRSCTKEKHIGYA